MKDLNLNRFLEYSIGIDLGGTEIKGVLLDNRGSIIRKIQKKTNDISDPSLNRENWRKTIGRMIHTLTPPDVHNIPPMGISAPGLTDVHHRAVVYMPGRMEGLENLHWSDLLESEKIWVLNDAKAAILAEHQYGVGKNMDHLVLLTLGTGVGGAIILNGRLFEGWLQRAGHFGHMSLDAEGTPGIVNLPGTLEMAVGNVTLPARSDGKFQDTNTLVKAYREGDPLAKEIWMNMIKSLAIGLCGIINIISPQMIILSGGITQAGDDLFHPLNSYMDQFEWRPGGRKTPIRKAKFKNFAGAVGAACFARQQIYLSEKNSTP